ncbi:excinuclease ABC subunit UvrB [Candidatus Microgenomates bacterium]|nr:excinuclease ABC subunit UvrB [Candidatus Microgenomates bacterium]
MDFKLHSDFKPTGDQPEAIEKLVAGVKRGFKNQVLLGVTGSGKTFTIANVIAQVQKPVLVISHNKTLAGQLYQEFHEFFPKNAVSYFVSYYDYYQPEAYVPQTDTYIEKETEINEEIDKLRLAATTNLLTRKDTLVVASVSSIYNLGSPVEYGRFIIELGPKIWKGGLRNLLYKLTYLHYARNDFDFKRGTFRVRGDTLEIFPAYEDSALRLDFLGDDLQKMERFDPMTGEKIEDLEKTVIYPAKHYMTNPDIKEKAMEEIKNDLKIRLKELKKGGKHLEAHRLETRTKYDLEMIKEFGFCPGIENYSRYFDGRQPGDPPYTLLNYYSASSTTSRGGPEDYLLIIDESHQTIPQIRGMYNGDRARKEVLAEYGFRLPSALDNRPLRFEEFLERVGQVIYVSATPNDWEINLARKESPEAIVEQLIRPTGLLDPTIFIRPTKGQVADLTREIEKRAKMKERVLATTLTKRMAEELSNFLEEKGIKVHYLHSEIETLDRADILESLRKGVYDVIVGINLLREGLDLPEVSLVAILDADKEGFLRSKTSLIQVMGRAARNVKGEVIMYADQITGSMQGAIAEIERRRKIQEKYNLAHKIKPESIQKPLRPRLVDRQEKVQAIPIDLYLEKATIGTLLADDKEKLIKHLTKKMREAAKVLDFETAALIRDQIKILKHNGVHL